jgi:hypothetical protein
VSDDRSQDSWDALFGVGAAASPPGAKGPQTPAGKLGKYLEMPGVRGVVRVALDGLVLDQAGEVDSEQHGALKVTWACCSSPRSHQPISSPDFNLHRGRHD